MEFKYKNPFCFVGVKNEVLCKLSVYEDMFRYTSNEEMGNP